MQTVKNRVLVETEYAGANVSCITTQRGLVLVDSPFLPKDGRDQARSAALARTISSSVTVTQNAGYSVHDPVFMYLMPLTMASSA